MLLELKEGHFIIKIGTIHSQDVTIINIYAANSKSPKYMKQDKIEGSNKQFNISYALLKNR